MLKSFTSNIANGAADFGKSRSGNIAIMGALVTPMLVMAAGFAVNVGHIYNTRSSMTQNLDVALTSTTREIMTKGLNQTQAMQAIANYVAANGNVGLSEADLLDLITLDIDRTNRTVHAQLKSDVRMPFSVFGYTDSYPVVVEADSAYADRPVEVAMMLDLTGSMNDTGSSKNGRRQSKLDNLKDAASDAVHNLLSRNQSGQKPRVRVALVPYAQGVNAGALADGNYIEDKKGRIKDEPIGLDELSLSENQTIKTVQEELKPVTDKCTTERKKKTGGSLAADMSDDPPEVRMVSRSKDLPNCPSSEVIPLSADESMLRQQIADFTGGGGTAGHIGVQWTRYVLSPKWADFLASKAGADAAPATNAGRSTSVRKVAILLTDGEFNTQYAAGNSAAMAKAHCTALQKNAEVFTIGFMLNDRQAKATMANCASPDLSGGVKHYYDASNATELNAAFEAITSNTEVIRLTN
jgi:Flp pilus assembly protein TadG